MSFSTPQRVHDLAITHGLRHAYAMVEASHGNGGGAPMTDAERAQTILGPEDVLDAYGSSKSGGMYEIALARQIAGTVRRTNVIPEPDYASVELPAIAETVPVAVAGLTLPDAVELPREINSAA